jgi:hypothetical protein
MALAQYRALTDLIGPGGTYYPAGSIFTDLNQPGWIPGTPMLDPLNSTAVQLFYAVGVQLLGRMNFGTPPPISYWAPFPSAGGTRPYALTGPIAASLGLSPINWTETRGAVP